MGDVQAKLVLKSEPGRSPTIVEESDGSVQKPDRAESTDSCLEVAGEVAMTLGRRTQQAHFQLPAPQLQEQNAFSRETHL
jgi:hypothetical protein